MFSESARYLWVVQRSFSHSVLIWKCDRVGSNWLFRSTAHHRDNAGRIKASTEESPNRYVADHLRFDRLAKTHTNFFGQVRFRPTVSLIRRRKSQILILRQLK